MDTATYINVLIDTLVKKIKVLEELSSVIKAQEENFSTKDIDLDDFDSMLLKKDILIEQLNQLDDGFEKIYLRVKEELTLNGVIYRNYILTIQGYIKEIMEKSAFIQTKEKQLKLKIDSYLINKKNEIKNFKISNQTANSYYKNMMNSVQDEPYFLDKKN